MAEQIPSDISSLSVMGDSTLNNSYDSQNNGNTTTTTAATAAAMPTVPRHFLSALFSSLARQWTLTRTLKSDNPMDINGILRGTATFVPLRSRGRGMKNENENEKGHGEHADGDQVYGRADEVDNMVYHEEGEIPSSSLEGMAGMMPMSLSGLRWSKKYIWRLRLDEMRGGEISVWFVKVGQGRTKLQGNNNGQGKEAKEEEEEEADYLFHTFEFRGDCSENDAAARGGRSDMNARIDIVTDDDNQVSPPTPPLPASLRSPSRVADDQGNEPEPYTTVLTAYGSHLCVNDMYHTAYAFRIRSTGQVVSWSSRHVVKGPKKNQDIVNLYETDD